VFRPETSYAEAATDHRTAFDLGRAVMDRQQIARAGEQLLDRGFLGALAGAVISGRARLGVVNLIVGRDDLVVEIIDHIAADGGDAVRGVNMDVHRALGMRVGGFTIDAWHQFNRTSDLEIEEAQRALGMQAVDEMLDVWRGILRVHQAGDGIFQLLAIQDDRGVHREQIVFAGMVDMQVGVADEADVAHAHAVTHQLVLDHVLVKLQAAHAQRLHDLIGAIAGVDHDRVLPADDQEAKRKDAAGAAAIATEHEKARFQLDIAIIQNLDLQRHNFLRTRFLMI
jgi:hypothetical protein